MLQFQIADAQKVSVFELVVEKPEKITPLITAAAKKYKLDRRLLSCLFKMESNYTLDAVSTTDDHGIGQINGRTAKGLKIDIKKLKTDLKYSIYRSAGILAYYQWLKAADEPTTWVCRYNVGPGRPLKGNVYLACVSYLARINWCRNGTFAVL